MPPAHHPAMLAVRHATLDGVRGLAVMGILLMNIIAFAQPEGAYFNPAAHGAQGPADYAAWALNALLVDGKMRGLFSVLFGASMLLVIDRADARDGNGLQVHLRRMAWLLSIGLAHNYLVWWGDILFHYAVIGTVACVFAYHDTRAMLRMAIACFAVQIAVSAVILWGLADLQAAATAPGADVGTIGTWLDTRARIGIATPDRLAAEIALWRGPYAGILHEMMVVRGGDQFFLLWAGGAETLGLMLLGMAGLRSGFLTGAWPRAAYARVARWGYAIGLPGTAALIALDFASTFDSLTVFGTGYVGGILFRPFMVAAHAALAILWFTRAGGTGWIGARIAAAGRMALSNYLGTSIAMAFLFYGWGLGLYATLGRADLYLVVLAAWGAMLAWSAPWLATHAYGPLEWAWRSLARGAAQPWRKTG